MRERMRDASGNMCLALLPDIWRIIAVCFFQRLPSVLLLILLRPQEVFGAVKFRPLEQLLLKRLSIEE
jgi:hypothetical protein